jgi:hypothetical protein
MFLDDPPVPLHRLPAGGLLAGFERIDPRADAANFGAVILERLVWESHAPREVRRQRLGDARANTGPDRGTGSEL